MRSARYLLPGGGGTGPTAAPASRPGPSASPTEGATDGTPMTTVRGTSGSDTVDRAAVDTEFGLTLNGGAMCWTARPGVGSITVTPSSGRLPDGASIRSGVGSDPVSFTCR
ncbi:hypothetical protein ACQEVB_31700 [Pseudonocardia sp. CA-107938]|uniref:hypothetical protein n=1 Tax=Pseudonocardia sp. CA-107938 TaxID=3240021 RepID=UPI003D8CB42C